LLARPSGAGGASQRDEAAEPLLIQRSDRIPVVDVRVRHHRLGADAHGLEASPGVLRLDVAKPPADLLVQGLQRGKIEVGLEVDERSTADPVEALPPV
jgi:hypothetical protein